MRPRRSALIALCGVGLAIVSACGGRVSDGANGHPSDNGHPSHVDGGSPSQPGAAPLGPECPSSIPNEGAACASDGRACEYGSDPDAECNTIARCFPSTWAITKPASHCPSPPPSIGPGCPATRASIQPGAVCSALGVDCAYPDGRCGCVIEEGGPAFPDAAPPSPRWSCENPPDPKCPRERPRIGALCVGPDTGCIYGVCGLPGRILTTCVGGYWSEAGDVCGSQEADPAPAPP